MSEKKQEIVQLLSDMNNDCRRCFDLRVMAAEFGWVYIGDVVAWLRLKLQSLATPPSALRALEQHPRWQQRSEEQLRATLSMLCHFVWYKSLRPGEHLWSIPVNRARDFDCILGDAITELVALRASTVSTPPDAAKADALNAHTLTLEFGRFLTQVEWREVAEQVRAAVPLVRHLRANAVATLQPSE